MPTQADWQELQDNCKWDWIDAGNTEFGGIAGYKVTSRKDGYKDRFIFLPSAGSRDGTSLYGVGSLGFYWSSSLYTFSTNGACSLYFYSDYVDWYYYFRLGGLSVRPVCP